MLNTLKNRLEQGYRTTKYPNEKIELPSRYRGRPQVNKDAPAEVIAKCADACPQNAIDASRKLIDMGRCVFCGTCERISKGEFISFTQDFGAMCILWNL